MVTHQLQVERRTGKVRQSVTDVLPLCHATVKQRAALNCRYATLNTCCAIDYADSCRLLSARQNSTSCRIVSVRTWTFLAREVVFLVAVGVLPAFGRVDEAQRVPQARVAIRPPAVRRQKSSVPRCRVPVAATAVRRRNLEQTEPVVALSDQRTAGTTRNQRIRVSINQSINHTHTRLTALFLGPPR